MKRDKIIIFDTEESFCYRFDDYLHENLRLPLEIDAYTSSERIRDMADKERVAALIIAEGLLEKYGTMGFARILVLDEMGKALSLPENSAEEGEEIFLRRISKYQPGEQLLQGVLDFLTEQEGGVGNDFAQDKWSWIGFYSPVKQCLQTSFALTIGKILAERKHVLYISFSPFGGAMFQNQSEGTSLTDLLYYAQCNPGKISLYLERNCIRSGMLDILPTAGSFWEMREIPFERWRSLLEQLKRAMGYDVLLLDLHETVEDLPAVLRECDSIYTITKKDPASQAKLRQYEQNLRAGGYLDVLAKTKMVTLPRVQMLPQDLEEFGEGMLADHARGQLVGEAI